MAVDPIPLVARLLFCDVTDSPLPGLTVLDAATIRLPDGAGLYLVTVIAGDKVLRSGMVVCGE